MVLEIRLSNFFSIKDEVILDLRAGNINTQKSKNLANNVFPFGDIDVLKTIAIYGANASGKSNIINAIRFCNAMVFESHRHNQDAVYNFMPFKFKGCPKKPSSYFIRFVIDTIEYAYSFSLNRIQILEEQLYYYPKGRKTKVFVRNEQNGTDKKDKYSFGTSVIKRPMDVAQSTSDKTLFISRASQMDRDIPKRVFNFFSRTFILNYQRYSTQNAHEMMGKYKTPLLKALQLADSDIVDFKQTLRSEEGKNLKANMLTEEAVFEDAVVDNLEIKTYHKNAPNIQFDFNTEESLGTKKLFFIMLTILDVVKNNKILLIDEIEDSLHTSIIEYIIEIFNASEGAQLLFTTHNTNLLNLNKMRKDQLYFANKQEDGSTDLYSLFDYKDFRDTMDVEKAYLQGRFDAIPFINDSMESLKELINE